MKTSRYIVLLYGAMILVPLLLFLDAFATVFSSPSIVTILEILITVGLVVYGIMGMLEAYGSRSSSGNKLTALTVESAKPYQVKKSKGEKIVEIGVKRFDRTRKGLVETVYKVNANRFTTVLDALISIKSEQDGSLGVRYSCRMGICGSCGIVVNGKPSLACETCVFDVAKEEKVEVEPMQAHPLLKDLVTDFDDFFEKHMAVKPGLFRKNAVEQDTAKTMYKQTKEERDKYLPFSFCIMCGLCMEACPVVNSNPKFIGPQALSQAYRYHEDSRDQMKEKRLNLIDSLDSVWGCEYAGACSEVCPQGVDPATAIQALKVELLKDDLPLGSKKE